MDRRQYLWTLGATGLGLNLTWLSPMAQAVQWSAPASGTWIDVSSLSTASNSVFDLSVASGDPSETGVILWTHIRPEAVRVNEALMLQVALDARFTSPLLQARIEPQAISADRDHTVQIDLNGQLPVTTNGGPYYYRFIYNGVVSRTGRCRTLPAGNASLKNLKLGLLTCQDYTNGYYGALAQVASDDSIDYVLHLGDFIYETAGDPSFQSLPFADRRMVLPSGGVVALDVRDYRFIYRTYRADPFLQQAMEQHTFICVPDDHETTNDCYWDSARDTLGAPDHPYTTDARYGNSPALLRQLKLDSQRAWAEYIPARVAFNPLATHPHEALKVYRRFKFAQFLDLNMLDTRTYRDAHPCGETEYGGRYIPIGCNKGNTAGRSIMGKAQQDWLIGNLTSSTATWKLLGNQTFMGRLSLTKLAPSLTTFNVDVWDGYAAERSLITGALQEAKVKNFLVATGDLHSHIASEIKHNFSNINPLSINNYVGAEFMTPAISSANLGEIALAKADPAVQKLLIQALATPLVYEANPHIRYFNSSTQGYSTLRMTDTYAEWVSYRVDKNSNSAQAARKCVSRQRKYMSQPWLVAMPTLGY